MLKFNDEIVLDAIIRECKCDKTRALRYINQIKEYSSELQPVLDAWIHDGTIKNFEINGVDINYIMKKMNTHFIAALMHMNRFIMDPGEADRFKEFELIIMDAYPPGGMKK